MDTNPECHLTIGFLYSNLIKKKTPTTCTYPDCLHVGCIMECWEARKASGIDQDFPNLADRPTPLHHSHKPWEYKMAPLTHFNEYTSSEQIQTFIYSFILVLHMSSIILSILLGLFLALSVQVHE